MNVLLFAYVLRTKTYHFSGSFTVELESVSSLLDFLFFCSKFMHPLRMQNAYIVKKIKFKRH